jgi:hypothetical protein
MQVRGFVSLVYSLALVRPQAVASTAADNPDLIPRQHQQLSTAQIQRELDGILSPGSVIFGVDDARYVNTTEPWNTIATPHIQLVIQPGEEADVSTIVRLFSPLWFSISIDSA